MKKIKALAIALVFIGSVSQADQKNKEKEVGKNQDQSNASSFIVSETAPVITTRGRDGVCPIIGQRYIAGRWITQYPPASADPDCPPK
jgi:hypothetical protein